MRELVTLLGVAFLTRFNLTTEKHPFVEKYRNPSVYTSLVKNASLRSFLTETDVVLDRSDVHRAAGCSIGMCFGLLATTQAVETYNNPEAYEKLLKNLSAYVRIRTF